MLVEVVILSQYLIMDLIFKRFCSLAIPSIKGVILSSCFRFDFWFLLQGRKKNAGILFSRVSNLAGWKAAVKFQRKLRASKGAEMTWILWEQIQTLWPFPNRERGNPRLPNSLGWVNPQCWNMSRISNPALNHILNKKTAPSSTLATLVYRERREIPSSPTFSWGLVVISSQVLVSRL